MKDSKSELSKPRRVRYPRSEKTFPGTVQTLRAVYNRLATEKNSSLQEFRYDIFSTKQGEKNKVLFNILARRLVLNHINPVMYLKILSRYGYYGRSQIMPQPVWLVKDSAMEIFIWLSASEKRKYPDKRDLKAELSLGNGRQSPRARFLSGVKRGWQYLTKIRNGTDSLVVLVISESAKLPEEFLCTCPEFLTNGGLSILSKKRRCLVIEKSDRLYRAKFRYEVLREYTEGRKEFLKR